MNSFEMVAVRSGVDCKSTPTNGNIAAWTHRTASSNLYGNLTYGKIIGQQFEYDKLNRIKIGYFNYLTNDIWEPRPDFFSYYLYDGNGNITQLLRAADQGNDFMDHLTYNYIPNTNKLDHVTDQIPHERFGNDIDSQQPGNYQYDAIGNLTRDYREDISNIDWTVQGKVASISKYDNTNIAFTYDAQGNRTSKTVTLPGGLVTTTYYVRDAQGNVMSVYKGTRESASWGGTGHDHVITLSEQPIYGSSRIGMRLGNGLEVKRINFPLSGDPQVVSNGNYTYTDLGQLISANISNEGAFITGAKAMPGISASLKAIAEDTYSLSLFTDNANPYGNLEYKLLQDNTNPVWEGETATAGTWSTTLTAGAETSDYQLAIRQKSAIFDQPIARHINGKQYEITDHLGNVRVVLSPELKYISDPNFVSPRVIATNTYYPFGMLIEPLSGNSEGYRYGFNQGSEKDDEITGVAGSHYTTYFRELDTRVVRWWTPDPKTKVTPWESPYSSMGGNPISNNDPKGDLSDWWQNNTGKAEKIDDKKLWDKGEMAKKGYSYLGEYQTDLFGTLGKPVYFNTVEIFNRDQDLWIVGYNLGGKHGRLEGEQGLIKVSKATNNLGTGMLLTPLAPVGEVLIIGSGLIDTGLDFKNISKEDATLNLGIRITTFGIGKGIVGQTNKAIKNEFGKRVIETGVNKGLNEIQNKTIEKTREINKKDD